jgi:lipoprotein-anchoring transpeptidase ErfK/SrfK
VRRASLLGALAAVTAAVALATGAGSAEAAKRPAKPVAIPHGFSLVAQARGKRVAVYRYRGAQRPLKTIRVPRKARKLVFLVDWNRRTWTWPKWVRVRLPNRPNGATAWVRTSAVRVLLTRYRVRVDLRRHELTVWRRGRLLIRAPVGVGRAVTPTPQGRYYLVTLLKPRNPRGAYGPYAFGLSAYSRVLTSFAGGPGQVGIHGTNRPRGLARNVSHGCIRVHNVVIRRMARTLPLGTPVDIVWDSRPRGLGSPLPM